MTGAAVLTGCVAILGSVGDPNVATAISAATARGSVPATLVDASPPTRDDRTEAREHAGQRNERTDPAQPRPGLLEGCERVSAVPALGEMRLDRGRLGARSAVDVVRDGAEHGAARGREPLEVHLRAAQDGAQPDPRTRDDLRDGVGPDAELGSDLRVRVALDLAKRQRASLTTGQHRGAATYEVLLLEQQRRALGIVLEVLVRPGRELDVAVGDLVIVATLLPQDVPGHRVQVAAHVHVGRGLGEAGDEAASTSCIRSSAAAGSRVRRRQRRRSWGAWLS